MSFITHKYLLYIHKLSRIFAAILSFVDKNVKEKTAYI